MVLSIFYGLGIMLLTIVNRTAGNQSGLSNFILGQSASMIYTDVWTMLVLALFVLAIVWIGFKEWKIYLFDPSFAKGLGLSLKGMNILYTLILVTTIVIGIQAVGVILIAALLIIPAVSARYWTHSFKWMMILSALFGGISGAMGTIFSALGSGWPTGPFIVIVASSLFTVSLFFGKEKGILIQYWQLKRQKKQVRQQPFTPSVLKDKEVQ
jgi:manganese/zinc/iron transport system permease protein